MDSTPDSTPDSSRDDAFRRRVDALFDAVLDLPAAERAAFLDAETPDPAVRAAVERLLSHVEPQDAPDGDPDDAPTRDLFRDSGGDLGTGGALGGALGRDLSRSLRLDPAVPEERIGPFRVVEEIGRGGMAAVYRAERTDGQFEQTVALKLALTGTGDPASIRRFHQERQILASLRHPSIAGLLDGGLTEDGRPWFALELVDGAPIDRFCDEHRLVVRERLRLFLEVARAVEAAHRALVIHRDLKPSNVLVSEEEGDTPRVKLLDFGIAKLVDAERDGSLTHSGSQAMTPEYASPEQLRGDLVTTASDIYQLGLLLYRLLSGRPAHRITRRNSPMDLALAVLERSPERPSTALSRPPQPATGDTVTAEEVGRLRGTTPEALRRTLSGDLDAIVLQTLHKEPERRYRSVGELADDIERYLVGRPVEARGDSRSYRLRRFVGRHRLGVSASAAALALIVGLVAFYTARLDAERDAARNEAARAETARAEAETVADFLAGLFEEADPGRTGAAEDVSARDLLERGAERLGEELAGQPLVRARLLATLSRTQERLGWLEEAEPMAREALDLRLEHLDESHVDVAAAHHRLGIVLKELGRYDEAEEHYRRAIAIQELAPGAARDLAFSLQSLGELRRRRGDLEESEKLLHRSLAILERTLGTGHFDLSFPLVGLGLLLQDLGRYDEAEAAYRRALALETAKLGEGHLATTSNLNNLANLLYLQARHEEALALHQRVLAIREEALGPDHPNVGGSLMNIASNLQAIDRHDEAVTAAERARSILEATLGPEHPRIALAEVILADSVSARGDPETAERHYRRALAIREKAFGPKHQEVAAVLVSLATILDDLGRFAEAEATHHRAIDLLDAALPDAHPFTAYGRVNLGEMLMKLDRHPEALPILRRAVEILEPSWGAGHPVTRAALEDLALVLDRLDRPEEAAEVRSRIPAEDPVGDSGPGDPEAGS